jgi:hypothetical protein
MINVFLWVCPLAGAGAFVAGFLAGTAPPPAHALVSAQFFDVPSARWIAMSLGTTLVPLIMACATRRAIGFLAGACLILLAVTGAAWWSSHRTYALAALYQFEDGVPSPTLHQWTVVSRGGGIGLLRQRWRPESFAHYFRETSLSPGRDRSIAYWTSWPPNDYPADLYFFDDAPRSLRRLGFALANKPRPSWDPAKGGVTFGIALPYWFMCLLAAPLPLAWLNRQRRRRRAARRTEAGACATCGYDLRATPDPAGARLAVCPECGAVTDSKPRSIH